MTREPFIAHSELTNEIYIVVGKEKYRITEQAIKAVMAIKALEQEPCEDCISRQAVLDMATTIQTDDFSGNEIIEVVDVDDIKALPSVKPQEPKEGCWIEVIDEIDSLENKTWHYECSICRSGNSGWGNYKYCPDCGTKMKVVSKQK